MFPVDRPPTPSGTKEVSDRFLDAEFFELAAAAEPKALSGISILGNQEAPKSLVIVPWKSSEIGNGIGVSRALDTRIRAVDKDVFMRELKYYGIRSGSSK